MTLYAIQCSEVHVTQCSTHTDLMKSFHYMHVVREEDSASVRRCMLQ
jgi:hypothetical protein